METSKTKNVSSGYLQCTRLYCLCERALFPLSGPQQEGDHSATERIPWVLQTRGKRVTF